MDTVQRLETLVDLDSDDGIPDNRHQAVKARLEAVLDNGRRVTLLDGRGWAGSGPANIWSYESVESVSATARAVVGPDEPYGGQTYAQADADHWAYLVNVLQRKDISATADDLANLAHHVVLSDRVLARLDT